MPRHTLPDGRLDARSLTLDELGDVVVELGLERFRALQVYKWMWQRGATTFDAMTNVSRATRVALAEKLAIPELEKVAQIESADGTRKYLWRTLDGHAIESVLIPDGDRLTLCVSTQVGCAMACTFCLTGDLGLKRNLRAAEIASQPLQVAATLPEGTRITNLVMMGMGEPLHNYDNLVPALRTLLDENATNFSHRRITVSTVGLIPAMQRLVEDVPVNLAVSLNATTEEQRRQVMPITRKYSMEQLLDACRALPIKHRERITFEYVMMAGFNDGLDDAARLVKLLHGIRAKVNLLPYNENPDRDIKRPSAARAKQFQHFLVTRGVQASIRTTRGIDISAACGQLGKAAMDRLAAARAGAGGGAPAPEADEATPTS